jgi:patatin-like phospholipase/acyl hydrolase
MPAYRILTIDGGGIRGIFAARVLHRLEQSSPGLIARVNLLAGTSTGGIIALGLAGGLSPDDLVRLYRDHAKDVFDDSWLDDLRDIGGVIGADYDNKKLKRVLERQFGTKRLRDLSKRVLVPAFDLDNGDDPRRDPAAPRAWKAKFFHNFPGPDSDGAESVVDVALRTSAAPTYFPSYQGYIDGGVVANNPAVAALAQAIHPATGGQKLDDVRLLSIGTGFNPTFIRGTRLDWGYAQWARPLITLMIDGVMGVADYQCKQLLRECYHRIDLRLPRAIPLDDTKNVRELIVLADRLDLTAAKRWVDKFFA